MIRVCCPGCHENLSFGDSFAGQVSDCMHCQKKFRLPAKKKLVVAAASNADDAPPRKSNPAQNADDRTEKRGRGISARPAPKPQKARLREEADDVLDHLEVVDDVLDVLEVVDDHRPRLRGKRKTKSIKGLWAKFTRQDRLIQCLLVLGFCCFVIGPLSLLFPPLIFLSVIVCTVLLISSSLWYLLIAFNEDTGTGLMVILVPFYSLYFLVSHFGLTCRPFFLALASWASIFICYIWMALSFGLWFYATKPAAAPVGVTSRVAGQPFDPGAQLPRDKQPGPGPDNDISGDIFEAAAKAAKDNRLTDIDIKGFTLGKPFREVLADGGVLIGLQVGVATFAPNNRDFDTISALRPIYLTTDGEKLGEWQGPPPAAPTTIKARAGYAIGAISLRSGTQIDGLRFTFMKLEKNRLLMDDSYTSDWVGSTRMFPAPETIGGRGTVFIGICGKQKPSGAFGVNEPCALGLVTISRR